MEAMYHAAVPTPASKKLGVRSGVGLVAANMIGAGVFLSAGFMAQDMAPGPILAAWVVGAVLALAGARAYAEIARLVPRSGGEYRYLSDLLHPALGYLSGWGSLLVGFSAPVAADALAAGGFAKTVVPWLDPQWTGAAIVVVLTALHVAGLETSARTQNLLIVAKVALVAGFVFVGLRYGAAAWPTWRPPHDAPGLPVIPFVQSLFFIAFAFSGWNAAVYAAEEFREPERTVPRAMMIGTALVSVLYLVVNWIFVANLTPEQASVVFQYKSARVTLGHAVVEALRGPGWASVMSVVTVVVFVSAMSAMVFLGPRVFQAMARDGFLPRALAGGEGRPPVVSILLQSALSILFIFAFGEERLDDLLSKVGAILTLFSALTVLGLLRAWLRPGARGRPSGVSVASALVYLALAGYMLWFAFRGKVSVLPWLAVISACALGAWALTRRALAGARRTEEHAP
ncbi:MAG TPA: amino acid permease [Anaeromyxobacteraceae bacterium]|nr:amino acid permease [Anaeromyxobacteraceae bacterium]